MNYINESDRQSSDTRFYKKFDHDPANEYANKIIHGISYIYIHYKDTLEYLKQDMPKAARFYLLPNIIHKENNPERPILLAKLPFLLAWNLFNSILPVLISFVILKFQRIHSEFRYATDMQNDVIDLVLREICKSKQMTDISAWPSRCHDTIYIIF